MNLAFTLCIVNPSELIAKIRRIGRVDEAQARVEIKAIRDELTTIAQAYNAAGMAVLNTLHPGGYVKRGRMPEDLCPLERAKVLLDRLAALERRAGLED
jgi:hypothetical protein